MGTALPLWNRRINTATFHELCRKYVVSRRLGVCKIFSYIESNAFISRGLRICMRVVQRLDSGLMITGQ